MSVASRSVCLSLNGRQPPTFAICVLQCFNTFPAQCWCARHAALYWPVKSGVAHARGLNNVSATLLISCYNDDDDVGGGGGGGGIIVAS